MTIAQFEVGNGVDYPRVELNPKNELTRVYKRFIENENYFLLHHHLLLNQLHTT